MWSEGGKQTFGTVSKCTACYIWNKSMVFKENNLSKCDGSVMVWGCFAAVVPG